ncbi:hypothetical protein P4C99_04305 [Pontiellaceae bacterium B1224]|nr:hypothetical protein [Pontiellaceae bacterium B1224]
MSIFARYPEMQIIVASTVGSIVIKYEVMLLSGCINIFGPVLSSNSMETICGEVKPPARIVESGHERVAC